MLNPFDTFDNIYCLNLKERSDRWDQCVKNFEKYDIKNYEHFLAYKVRAEDISPKREGQLGCAFSFCEIFKDAKEKQYNSILILEDDFDFLFEKDVLFEKLNLCLDELPKDWDMFYLGANVMDEIHETPLENYSNNLLRLLSGYTLHSVAISKQGIEKITSEEKWDVDILYKYEAIDVFFAQIFQIKNRCFLSKEILSTQRPDFSSIEGTFYNYQDLMVNRFNFFKKYCES